MKKPFIISTFILVITAASFAQDITGDWNGTLKPGGGELRLVLHITKNADGTLKATLDSIDQGANAIPVTAITLKDSKLNLKVDAVNGTYDGKVNADTSEIDGMWSQGGSLELIFHRGNIAAKPAPKPAKPSDIDGDWLGTLDTGMARLRLVLHISNTEDGLTASVDSLDQNAKGLQVTSITRTGPALKFEMKAIGGAYAGTIAKDLAIQESNECFRTGTAPATESGEALSLSRRRSFIQQPGGENSTRRHADHSSRQRALPCRAVDRRFRAA